MLITGFTDEVSDDLSLQIKALKKLGWKYIDLRTVDGKNVSSLTDQEFDLVYQQLTENDIKISCFGSTIANLGRDAVDSFSLGRDAVDSFSLVFWTISNKELSKSSREIFSRSR